MRSHLFIAALMVCAASVQAAHDTHEPAEHHAPPPVAVTEHAAHAAPAPALPAPVVIKTDAPATEADSVSADDAIKMLADGNDRFVARSLNRPHQDAQRNCETFASGEHPYAAVLACADSRVPVELVFDAGIGDLFTTRVAGNVSNSDEIGTIEYGVEQLGINVVLVLGHTKCGAVSAVVNHTHVTLNIEKLIANIAPASAAASKMFPQLSGNALIEKAVVMNVRQSMSDLIAKSELLAERVKSGKLKIVGAVYDLHTGAINWLEPQTAPIAAATIEPPVAKHEAEEPKAESHSKVEKAAKRDEHAEKAENHEEPEHAKEASKAEGHEHASTQPAAPHASIGKENFVVLGVLLIGAGFCSWGTMQFVRGRKATKTESVETPKH